MMPSVILSLKTMVRICISIFLFQSIIFQSTIRAGSDDDTVKKIAEHGFYCLYKFDFTHADSTRQVMMKLYDNHPWTYLFSVNYFWWMIITEKDRSTSIRKFYECLDSAEKKLKLTGKNRIKDSISFDLIYSYIYLYAYRSRIDLLEHNLLSALVHANTGIDFLEISFGNEKNYHPFYLTSGLYYFSIGYSRKHHPWLAPAFLLIPDGDIRKGKQYLDSASHENNIIIRTEGIYFLMKIFYEYEPSLPAAEIYASILCKSYPDNLIYRYYLIRIIRERKNDASGQLTIFEKSLAENQKLTKGQKVYFTELLNELKSR